MSASVGSGLSIGTVFAGRYRIERHIAAGGMGSVYEVVHTETNRRRALKVMHAHYVQSEELRARFRIEARVAANVESEHIVDVSDAGIDEATGMPFLVMELLRGEELGKLIKRVGALPKADVVRYLYETSLALDKTHRARIVHRDLKPDNLFLCERERGPARIKVLDFGIAKIVSDASTQANATKSLGTPLYMAPEQFSIDGAVSIATDIFALGMIAFTLLVGKPYWHREAKMAQEAIAFAIHVAQGPRESAVARASELFGVELPTAFDDWFFKATAREPAARFASAGEAAIELAKALGVPSPDVDDQPQRMAMPSRPYPNDQDSGVSKASPSPLGLAASQVATPLAMTPSGKEDGSIANRSRSLVFVAMAATLVIGLGIWVVSRLMTSNSEADNASIPKESPEASKAVSSAPLVTSRPMEPTVSAVQPVVGTQDTSKTADAPQRTEKVAPKVTSKPEPKKTPGATPTKTAPTNPWTVEH